jgi:asparagine synthase (glutamine-hydrolysing)
MCGIAVAVDWDGAEAAVRQMIGGILHRGDITDPVISPRPNIAMCTRRLRIVDADHAVQPQCSFDERLLVALNGEIYNHVELRNELSAVGIKFRTASDTEVLANALRIWGAKALDRIRGMYAFVAVDMKDGQFLAARDPFGVKPLYLIQSGTGFLFCSEIRPLLRAAETGDVMLLPPGYVLARKLCAPFRQLPNPPAGGLKQGSARELDRLLSEAVRLRLPPDLPFATMLSGGIDSTLVAHYARQYRPESPSYFLGGPDAPDYTYAEQFADKSKLDLRIVPFEPESADTISLIEDVVDVIETFEPDAVTTGVCSYVISRRIHEDGFRVALCGEGADELFAGYRHLEAAFAGGNAFGRPAREECLSLMNRVNLQRVDRCSMQFCLETREPFLDQGVVDYALNLDSHALVRRSGTSLTGKMPLRELYDLYPDELPSSVRDRRKIPFDEGAGLYANSRESSWMAYFRSVISDSDFEDGKREFASYDIRTIDELFYLRRLAKTMDVSRVPHLRGRARVSFPDTLEQLELVKDKILV